MLIVEFPIPSDVTLFFKNPVVSAVVAFEVTQNRNSAVTKHILNICFFMYK